MIGVVLIGHGHIASEMLLALQHVVGEQPLIACMDVVDDRSPERLSVALQNKLQACDVGDGVLLLADMFGGTPCNVAMGCLQAGHVEVISGFNLPLLIKAVTLRQHDKNVLTLAQQVVKFGRQYIQLTPNSVAQNSVAPNSVAPNSVAPNSVAPNSVAPNSVAQASKEHADG